MKAFLIARVSTADQIEALPGQVYRLTDYAKSKGYDYELFEFNESAYKGDRQKFRAIIEKIQSSKEPIIVVFDKVDRFTRDSSDEETRILKKLYLSGKIEIHFPSENLYLNENSPSTDKMRLGLNTVFAEYYSDAISDNVKRRNDQLWRDGIWTSAAPFGYKNITRDDKTKWIELNPLQAEAVKIAFELYVSGNHSLKTIRTKSIENFGLTLSGAQWHKILRNPFYCGTMRIKGKLLPHNYETIISPQLFEQVKVVFEGYDKKPRRWAGLPYPYRGLINCSECGCRVTFEKKKNKYTYGHCTQYKGKHGAQYISQDSITEQLRQVFYKIQLPEEGYVEVSNALTEDSETNRIAIQKKLSAVNAQVNRYKEMIERNYEAYLEGAIDKEKYLQKNQELITAKHNLENSRENIELMSKDNFEDVSYLLNISREAPEIFENAENEDKRELINLVLSNLRLSEKELRWELKKPFDTMAFCNETRNWLGMRESNPRSWDQNPVPYHLANPQ
jgi:site-specific DNA recombinase